MKDELFAQIMKEVAALRAKKHISIQQTTTMKMKKAQGTKHVL